MTSMGPLANYLAAVAYTQTNSKLSAEYTGRWLAGWQHTPAKDDDIEEDFPTYFDAMIWLLRELNWIGSDEGGAIADAALRAGNILANRAEGSSGAQSFSYPVGEATFYIIRQISVSEPLDTESSEG